jgi:3',5'-cyclic AMP phosphodiesterase CpdA
MTRLAWLSDLHLDFLDSDAEVAALCRGVAGLDPDGVLISGDIGNAATLEHNLRLLETHLRRPVYFVLGNHDFYGGSISGVRREVEALCARSTWLHWLPAAGLVPLGNDTWLVGHDSWGDGRLGSGSHSPFILNDYYCIRDFQGLSIGNWFERMAALGDEAAAFLRDILPRGFESRRRMILVTHVPPFREAAWHLGRPSDDAAAPHFCCKAVGDVLVDVMTMRPECAMTVLCGHTHSPGVVQVLPNLEVRTAGAEYGSPRPQPGVILVG